jgi:hypothetical protein
MNVDQKVWGEHLGLAKFCYNFIMHLMTKMSLFELALGKEAKKPMDLAIPMGLKDHSKKTVKMVKGCEKLYAQANKLLK